MTLENWNNPTSFIATVGSPITLGYYYPWVYLQLTDDGTNLTGPYSLNGVDFYVIASEARTSWLASPNQVGLHCGNNTLNGGTVAIFDWFRRTA